MDITRRQTLAISLLALTGCLSRVSDQLTGRWEQKQEILEIYENGVSHYNDGVEDLQTAIQRESFRESEQAATDSVPHFSDAIDFFQEASELSAEINAQEARETCANAERKATLMREAAELYSESSARYEAGNRQDGGRLRDQYREHRESAQAIDLPSSRELAEILGMSG